MRLIIEELKKILRIKYLGALVVGIIIASFALVIVQDKRTNTYEKDHLVSYEKFKGLITREKYEYVKDTYEALAAKYSMEVVAAGNYEHLIEYGDQYMSGSDFSDMGLYGWLNDEYQRIMVFSKLNNEKVEKQKDKVIYFEALGRDDLAQKIDKSLSRYEGRFLSSYHYVEGMERLIQSNNAQIFSLLLAVFVAISLTTMEQERNMDAINETTYEGKHKLKMSKLFAMLLFMFMSALLIEGVQVLAYYSIDFIDGFSMPIYQIKSFMFFPYNWSIFNAIAVSFFIKYSFTLLITLLLVFVSYKSKTQESALLRGAVVVAVVFASPLSILMQGINALDWSLFLIAWVLIAAIFMFELLLRRGPFDLPNF